MSKVIRKKYENIIYLLTKVTQNIFLSFQNNNIEECFLLLEECQESAIALGTHMEKMYKRELKTVKVIEQYCEDLYHIGVMIAQYDECLEKDSFSNQMECQNTCKQLERTVKELQQVFHEELENRREVVFMPYKAAMWDSLESVWMAAEEDPNCDAYVIPIPYYDRNPDHSLGTFHYEGDLFPAEVPITYYEDYDLEERQPDAIYIHNPYDWANNATSIDPRFYSDKLKANTECLVYIPYYTTSGGMAEAQEKCLAYYNADYIVIQSEKYRKFFDPALPDEKFLPYGSPKFDRVIRICNNPPEPPVEWVEKMHGKKVYFYNTSLNGMLQNTDSFFKKMQYVFDCFKDREDACLLWRPHPLFETTIDSMRPSYRPIYEKLKKYFHDHQLGIYDETPDITNAIAQCDAYIGDAASSVVSLFGVAGKPVFILNNRIHCLPEEEDWKAEFVKGVNPDTGDEYKVVYGNKLYHAPNNDYRYHYVCDLNEKSGGVYYLNEVYTRGARSYVCPRAAQEILVIENERIIERILLVKEIEQQGAFRDAIMVEDSLYLIPQKYPAIVRYDTKYGTLDYIKGYNKYIYKWAPDEGKWKFGGTGLWKHYLLLASPTDSQVVAIDNHTRNVKLWSVPTQHKGGFWNMFQEDDWIWMLPETGTVITKWNPQTMEVKEYSHVPEDFHCIQRPHGYVCMEKPFTNVYFYKDKMYIAPQWGNMFLCLDKETGTIERWQPFFPALSTAKNGYYRNWITGTFIWNMQDKTDNRCWYYSVGDAKLYKLDFANETYEEVFMWYEKDEAIRQLKGFTVDSDWMRYCCTEDAINTLPAFFDIMERGNYFSKEKQLKAYEEINASCDGDCGKRVYEKLKIF